MGKKTLPSLKGVNAAEGHGSDSGQSQAVFLPNARDCCYVFHICLQRQLGKAQGHRWLEKPEPADVWVTSNNQINSLLIHQNLKAPKKLSTTPRLLMSVYICAGTLETDIMMLQVFDGHQHSVQVQDVNREIE